MHEPFSVATDDSVTEIHGELMIPVGEVRGAVLIVPGGWFMDRDGFTGDSYTEDDLMYARIARRMLREGYLVARYDNRGVTGNELKIGIRADTSDPGADSQRYLDECVDCAIRQTVTPGTLAADARLVYQHLADHDLVDPTRIGVFAHSEGGLHVARLIDDAAIAPKCVLMASVTAESPMETLRWQAVDRYVNEVLTWDRDWDGLVTLSDIEASFETSMLPSVGITVVELTASRQTWNRQSLLEFFSERYEAEKRAAMKQPDDAPFPQVAEGETEFVAASQCWWKQWFVDERSTVELLQNYCGRVTFHFGELDAQIPVERQIQLIDEKAATLACHPNVVIHEGRGHALRTDQPMAGPMDYQAEDVLIKDLLRMMID